MTRRTVKRTSKFKKEYRKSQKQGKNMALLNWVIDELANDRSLPAKYHDHALKGDWKEHRECHISPDLLLIYRKESTGELLLILVRLASHSELDF